MMKQRFKNRLRPILFTLGGMTAGYLYYRFIGCSSGSCAITSNPANAILYMGIIGWLVSGIFGKRCRKCNM